MRPPWPTSLRWRLVVWLVAGLATVSILLSAFHQYRIQRVMTREADARLASLSQQLAAGSVLGVLAGSERLLQSTIETAMAQRDVRAVAVYDSDGFLITHRERDGAGVPPMPEDATCFPCRVNGNGLRWVSAVERRETEGEFDAPEIGEASVGWLVVDVSTAHRVAESRSIFVNSILISLMVILGGFVATLLLARRLTAPLNRLANATRQVAGGNWSVPPALKTRYKEIDLLADEFRAMTQKLGELDAENREARETLADRVKERTQELEVLAHSKDELVANVSHDFRSPLGIVSGFIQTILRDEEMPPETRTRFLEHAQVQCKRLESLVENLLEHAELQDKPLPRTRHCLNDLLEQVLDAQRAPFERAGVELRGDIPPKRVFAEIHAGKVDSALTNLLENARKFSSEGDRVTVDLEPENGLACIGVEDTGPGIPADEQARVFDAFFQGDHSRARSVGSGLGLAIVKGVAENHGGSVVVQSIVDEGTRFELRLPLSGE